MYEDIDANTELIDPTFSQSSFQVAAWLVLSILCIAFVTALTFFRRLYDFTPWAHPHTPSRSAPQPRQPTDRTAPTRRSSD